MGNTSSSGNGRRRNSHHHHHHHSPSSPPPINPQQSQEIPTNRLYAYAPPFPPPNPNPNTQHYYQYTAFYQPAPPAMPMPLPASFDHHHRGDLPDWAPPVGGGRYPMPPVPAPSPAPYVEHQKAVTIRNEINLKKETLRVEPDEQNPGKFLVAFTFDATVPGSITVLFFAKEELECNLIGTKESLEPITVHFKAGLGQNFRQPCGTGIDFSMFEGAELTVEGDAEVYPLAVKAEASLFDQELAGENENTGTPNSQITQAMFVKKENSDYQVRVLKQILWVKDTRYELQEIYGIGNSVEGDFDGNDPGKECVICLSEPRDTAVLPCRHMCMCSGCAKVLRFQTNRCPICRQPVERLLEIKVNRAEEQAEAQC